MSDEHNVHQGHRERLRERYLQQGLDTFAPHNVLELMLFYALPRRDTNEIAHSLMDRFGSFSEVLDAPLEELEDVDGMGRGAAVFLKMIPDIQRYYMNDKTSDEKVRGEEEICEYVFNRLTAMTEEHVLLVCVDNTLKMISADIVCKGSVNSSGVNMRGIVNLALRHNAVAAYIAHNHPRGYALPSQEDLTTTKHIHDALETINVRLLDHIICNSTDYCTLAKYPDFAYLFE